MSHKFKVGQAVVQAFRSLDCPATYQIVSLMPACSRGEPQYLIQCRLKGMRRLVREGEVAAAFPSSALPTWAETSSDTPAVRVENHPILGSGGGASMTGPASVGSAPGRAEQAKRLIQEARLARMRTDPSISSVDQEMVFAQSSGADTFPMGLVATAMAET
jgi:hypothetical protein